MNEILISTELGLVHEGSLGIALSLIDAACDAGANAIKMQMHIAEEESLSRVLSSLLIAKGGENTVYVRILKENTLECVMQALRPVK